MLAYLNRESEQFQSESAVHNSETFALYNDHIQLDFVEMLRSKTPDRVGSASPDMAKWARFFLADSDKELAMVAMEDVMIAKATDELRKASESDMVRYAVLLCEGDRALIEDELNHRTKLAKADSIVEGLVNGLFSALTACGVELTQDARSCIESCTDPERFSAWFVRAMAMNSGEDVFAYSMAAVASDGLVA